MTPLDRDTLGRYRILERIGEGAMGTVYKAEDPSLGRVVALKAVELTQDAVASADYQARFYQEAKAAGGLNHPHIITIYDTGREDNWAYIAMELLEGEELRDLMAASRLPIDFAVTMALQVAGALQFAHDAGVVHRDIKPGNIMVLRGDHAKLMDFGIARMRVSAVETQVGLVLGSPKYMSPEQVQGQRVDHRSDIFSLGVVLYEMAAGIAPFAGNDMGELMYAVVNHEPPRAGQLNPQVPEILDLIIAKALAKDVAARYQSAREMAHDLAGCLAQLRDLPPPAAGTDTLPLARDPGAGDPDATTVPMAAAAAVAKSAPPPLALFISRRVDSSAALERLMMPTPGDPAFVAPVAGAGWKRWLRSPRRAAVAGLFVVAVAGAIVIAVA